MSKKLLVILAVVAVGLAGGVGFILGSRDSTPVDLVDRSTTKRYYSSGELLSEGGHNPDGSYTIKIYNRSGQLFYEATTSIDYNSIVALDDNILATDLYDVENLILNGRFNDYITAHRSFNYDQESGELYLEFGQNPDGLWTEKQYYPGGQLNSEKTRNPDGSETGKSYYENGQLGSEWIRNPDGSTVEKTYTETGELESEQTIDPTESEPESLDPKSQALLDKALDRLSVAVDFSFDDGDCETWQAIVSELAGTVAEFRSAENLPEIDDPIEFFRLTKPRDCYPNRGFGRCIGPQELDRLKNASDLPEWVEVEYPPVCE